MRTGQRIVSVVAAAVLLSAPTSARGEPPESVALLLRQAFELRRVHRNQEALDVYAKAFALSPTPDIRAQLALAEQTLGRWIEAERDLDGALATDNAWIEKNRAALESARRVIQAQLAWLTVDVDPRESELELDGQPFAAAQETRVVGGSAVLEVRAAGHVPDARRVALTPGEHVRLQVTLAPVVPGLPEVRPSPVSVSAPIALSSPSSIPGPDLAAAGASKSSVSVGPLALGGAALVAIGIGAYYGVRVIVDKGDVHADCVNGCRPVSQSDFSDGQTSSNIANVAFGVGAGLAVGGAAWWLLTRKRPQTATSVHLLPMSDGRRSVGLMLEGYL